ncbi:acetate uptake transporter [Methanoregula formicica]|uniref:Putative membrane protein n=1 Tax=Methanoregula formicica (strain DSM 22288 / NBRC 105244 / SMSP) TaxID=593750 RepID=L0HHN2_METFS|nr:GPR1/FUN34/YaaH family transporter [Methanoregula formicica]AGB03271.1 putative membrane protein [Methanoregula formicica SMSP]
MESDEGKHEIRIIDTTGNPAPLGLLAFGMTTVMLNLHNAGLFALGSMIFAMGIFYGGIAQIIAGIMEWKKNNTFGTLAFISYGFFWISLVGLIVMPKLGMSDVFGKMDFLAFLGIWGLFSFVMWIITWRIGMALNVVFGLLVLLFLLLIIGNATGNILILTIAGIEGIICGLSAMYAGLGQVMNEVYKEKVINLG